MGSEEDDMSDDRISRPDLSGVEVGPWRWSLAGEYVRYRFGSDEVVARVRSFWWRVEDGERAIEGMAPEPRQRADEVLRQAGAVLDVQRDTAQTFVPQRPDQGYAAAGPECCRTCWSKTGDLMTFIVCATCGNKRCPKAEDHRNDCSGSNAPGQHHRYPGEDGSDPMVRAPGYQGEGPKPDPRCAWCDGSGPKRAPEYGVDVSGDVVNVCAVCWDSINRAHDRAEAPEVPARSWEQFRGQS